MKPLPWFVNRKTFTALTLIAGLSLGAQTVLAESSQRQSPRWDYIFTQLDVTDEQQAQVHDLFQELAAERRAKMQEHREARRQYREASGQQYQDKRERRAERQQRPDREAWQAERQARREQARQNLQDRLGTILTPDQVEGFIAYLNAHKPMHKHHGGRDHKKRGERRRRHDHGRSD